LLRESIHAALARLPNRFRQRVRSRVHVALCRGDIRVTGEHLQFVHRNSLVGEARQRLVSQVVPVQVDLPKRLSFESPLMNSATSKVVISRFGSPLVDCDASAGGCSGVGSVYVVSLSLPPRIRGVERVIRRLISG